MAGDRQRLGERDLPQRLPHTGDRDPRRPEHQRRQRRRPTADVRIEPPAAAGRSAADGRLGAGRPCTDHVVVDAARRCTTTFSAGTPASRTGAVRREPAPSRPRPAPQNGAAQHPPSAGRPATPPPAARRHPPSAAPTRPKRRPRRNGQPTVRPVSATSPAPRCPATRRPPKPPPSTPGWRRCGT